jgi:hypothetical protein
MKDRCLGEWTAHQVQVMRSEFHPEGSRYSCQAEIPLPDAAGPLPLKTGP